MKNFLGMISNLWLTTSSKRIARWRGKLLSYAARVILIITCLASIPVCLLFFLKFPKWTLELINIPMANCMWNDFEGHKKIYLADWKLICKKKEFGGLGIPDLGNVNLCLLSSWVKRYLKDEGKLWRTLVDSKYDTGNPSIFCSKTTGSSQFWKRVMWAVHSLKFRYRWKIGDGTQVRLWEDTWFGTSPLAVQFFKIYEICNEQGRTVKQVWDGSNLRLPFRRNFSVRWKRFNGLAIWAERVYSCSSHYDVINFGGVKPECVPAVWKLYVPPRVYMTTSFGF